MGVAQTSLWAYRDIKEKLGKRHKLVYDALCKIEPAHNSQIAEYLGLPINQITGRVNELQHLGMIQIEKIDKNERGRKVKFWSTIDRNDMELERISKQLPEWEYDKKGRGNDGRN